MFWDNKIDRLVKENARLLVKKQKVDDKRKSANSQIENKLQNLENKAFVIKQNADNKIAEIERKIKKNKEQIKLEKDYYNSIGSENSTTAEPAICSYKQNKKKGE